VFKKISTLESQQVDEVKNTPTQQLGSSLKRRFVHVYLENLLVDPRERIPMFCYHPNDRDEIRRTYKGCDAFLTEGFSNWKK